jgi:hemolysin activation/secretion protein
MLSAGKQRTRRGRLLLGGFSGGFAVGIAAAAAPVFAQALPGGVPQSVQPGRVLQQFTPQVAPPAGAEIEVPAPNPEHPPTGAEKVSFKLSEIVIAGNTVYPPGTLNKLYAGDIGKTVTLSRVYDIANEITDKYRADGYILSQAVVPAQRIHGGSIKIIVVEGFIDQVKVQGDDSKRLEGYAAQIRSVRPLTSKVLERYLLLANDLPGMSVQSVLAPSPKVTGAADMTLVAKRKTAAASLEMDNFGSAYQGPWQGTASASLADVLGHDELIALRTATTSTPSQMSLYGLNLSAPVDDDGTSLVFDVSRTRGHPGFTLAPFDVRTLGYSGSLALQRYMIRSRAENLLLSATFSYVDSKTRLNIPGSSDDKIRALRFAGNYTRSDNWGGQNSASLELSEGLPILDASRANNPTASRQGGRPDFTKGVFNASRLQDLSHNFGFLFGVSAQTAFGERLLSSEQFGLGGSAYGRGYDPSEITGDNGVAAKFELQKTVPFTVQGRDRIAQFFGFYDVGAVMTSALTGSTRQTLASTGAGVRLNLGNGIVPMFEIAKPLTRPVASEIGDVPDPKGIRLYFTVSASF